jgi:transcriptional regulator with XRE-family HTH domain
VTKFGKYLERLRREHGLSIRDAARNAKISDSYLGLLERGKRTNIPGSRVLVALARIYSVDAGEMLMEAGAFFEADNLSEDEMIDQAFRQVLTHPDFRHYAKQSGEVPTETKLLVIDLYEKLTGESLLKRT